MDFTSESRLAAIELSSIRALARHRRLVAFCRRVRTELKADAVQANVITDVQHEFVAEWPLKRRLPEPLNNSACSLVVIARRTLTIPSTRLNPLTTHMSWTREWGGYMGTPIFYADQAVGTLCALTHEARTWSVEDVELLERMASQLSKDLETRGAG